MNRQVTQPVTKAGVQPGPEIPHGGELQPGSETPHGAEIQLRLEAQLGPEAAGTYPEMVFHMPEGMEVLKVVLKVEHHGAEQSVIDLGVRDAHRMRGWSGGARDCFRIGPAEATPGYLPGPLARGEWAVVLGAHRVAEAGCTANVEITLFPSKLRWLSGDLHLHTEHSDGTYSVEDTMAAAREAGLDFIVLTDHNTSSQNVHAGYHRGVLVLPGMELTTGKGHCNLYGAADPLPDFRADQPDALRRRLVEAKANGAYISINHPHCPDCGWHWGFDADYDWVEIWNGPWREANALTLDWWQRELASGRRLTAVAGSDTHRPHPLVKHGWPTVWVLADSLSQDGILNAIREGRVTLSFAPDGPRIELSCDGVFMGGICTIPAAASRNSSPEPVALTIRRVQAGDEIRIWSERGEERRYTAEQNGSLSLEWQAGGRRFWRAEVWRDFPETGQLLAAASNPVYFAGDEG
ncbi:CehA/McbA family metallohydrolase [Paenibacillus sp. CN-4]|uniref:CehA/McbA family metallohydrolase n=1 Tax=Paenibacillus nanchangensis TaxID=3348343 RepID=UPI00397B4CB1